MGNLYGVWSDKRVEIGGWSVCSYNLQYAVKNCRRFTLNYTVVESKYTASGNCNVFVYRLDKGWEKVGTITLNKADVAEHKTVSKTFELSPSVSFDKLLVIPTFSLDHSCRLSISDAQLDSAFSDEPKAEGADSWGVVGSFDGNDWSTDRAMTERDAGVWVSDGISMKAGDEFKVRLNGSWEKNYGVNKKGTCVEDGDNAKVDSDDTYVVILDLNKRMLTAIKPYAVLPKAAIAVTSDPVTPPPAAPTTDTTTPVTVTPTPETQAQNDSAYWNAVANAILSNIMSNSPYNAGLDLNGDGVVSPLDYQKAKKNAGG